MVYHENSSMVYHDVLYGKPNAIDEDLYISTHTCTYMYICIYVCIYVCRRMYVYRAQNIHMCMLQYKYTYVCMHICMHMNIYVFIDVTVSACTRMCNCTQIITRPNTHTHYAHTHTHTHVQINMYMWFQRNNYSLCYFHAMNGWSLGTQLFPRNVYIYIYQDSSFPSATRQHWISHNLSNSRIPISVFEFQIIVLLYFWM